MLLTPRVAAVHDLSGFGRCSLTVAIPILSAMGVQCCPLPTAFLSTHTGGFQGFTFLDMTEEMPRVSAHWKGLGIRFQAVYSGFLGSARQIGVVSDFIRDFRTPETLIVVDPVMGDDGRAYQTCTPDLCAGMAQLAEEADVITPNLTEAAFLLGQSYKDLAKDCAHEGGTARAAVCGSYRGVTGAGENGRHVLRRENRTDRGGPDRFHCASPSWHWGCIFQCADWGVSPGCGIDGSGGSSGGVRPGLCGKDGETGPPSAGRRGF